MNSINSILLERGKAYPLPIPMDRGAAAQFLTMGGSMLQVKINGMTRDEEWALRFGRMWAGMLAGNGAILWLFRFCGRDNQPLLSLDAPYDIRLLPPERRDLPSIDKPQQRLLIDVHAIDERDILRGLRGITLSPDLTLGFLSAAQDQLASLDRGEKQMDEWMRHDTEGLMRMTKMWECGL